MTFKAQGFNATYGNNISVDAINNAGDYILITQPEPWALLEHKIDNRPLQIIQSGDLPPQHLDNPAKETPAVTGGRSGPPLRRGFVNELAVGSNIQKQQRFEPNLHLNLWNSRK